jgi:hypothetical protein
MVPVFCDRPFGDKPTQLTLESLIAEWGGEVVLECDMPEESTQTLMLMAAFPGEDVARQFEAAANELDGVSAEISALFRVGEVLHGK